MKSKDYRKNIKIGQSVTAKSKNIDGDTVFVSGEISSINEDIVFISRRFPKVEHFSVKIKDLII
jgi:hypothetical protein